MTCSSLDSKKVGGAGRPVARHGRGTLRLCIVAALLFALTPRERAQAADWLDSPLRGSLPSSAPVHWDGINFGGHLGVGTMDTDFGGSTSQLVAHILRNSTLEDEAHPSSWTTLPNNITNGRSYGAFLGYNTQWEGVIIGFDAAYNRMSGANAQASDRLSRSVTTSDGYQHDVTITAQSSMQLVDYATARVRAGYPIGQFLPYGFVGAAVGRFNYTTSATVSSHETPPAPGAAYNFGPQTQSNNKDNAVTGGFTAGLGVDVALTPNVFARGEWEFVGFAPINGIRASINTARAGIGVRF